MSDADTSKCGSLNSTSVSSFGSCASYQGSTYSPYPTSTTYSPAPSCPSGQWWDTARQACTSTATTCVTGYYWDSAANLCKPSSGTYSPSPGTTYTYTPYPSCPSGQWWDTATSTCKSIATYTPYVGYCGDNVCGSSETSSSCPSDCGGGTSYTPYPTSTYTYTPPPSCPADQYWNGTSCVSNVTYTPAPTVDPSASCTSSGGTWNGSSCVFPSPSPSPTASLSNHYIVAHCQQLGRTWNGKICQANGLFARFFEGSGMANALRLFYIIP